MIPRFARFLVVPVLLAASAAVAQPQTSAQPSRGAQVRKACAADIQRLCPDSKPGHGDLRMCLRNHENDLSPECKSTLAAMRQQRAKERQSGDMQAPPQGPPSQP